MTGRLPTLRPVRHDDVARSLAAHLRARSKPPLVFEEIALAGSYGSDGRLDVAALYIGPEYAGAWVEGYEVKGSRADLMRDLDARKWERYRGHGLRRFSFAFPEGIAKPSEIPKEAGVIVLRSLSAEGRGDLSEPSWRTVRRGEDWGGEKLPRSDVLLRMLRRSEQAGEQARREASALEQRRVRVAELLQEDDLALSWRLRGKIAGLAREVERAGAGAGGAGEPGRGGGGSGERGGEVGGGGRGAVGGGGGRSSSGGAVLRAVSVG